MTVPACQGALQKRNCADIFFLHYPALSHTPRHHAVREQVRYGVPDPVRRPSGPLAPAPSVADLAGGRWPAGLDDRLPSVFRAGRPESATAVAFASASRLQRAASRPWGRAVQGTAPRPGGHRRAPSSHRPWGLRPAACRLHPRSLRSRLLLSSQPSPGGRDFHGARGFAPHPPANPRWGAGGPGVT